MNTEELLYLIWFVQTFGGGNHRISQIISAYGSAYAAYCAVTGGEALAAEIITAYEQRAAAASSVEDSKNILGYCERKNIKLIPDHSDEYPERLKNIYNPPPLLFCRGKTEILADELSLTVVGTRHPCDYSVRVCDRLAGQLAELGFTIASGFAVGIDITAHLAAVRNGGKTVSVLGCGLDVDYPGQNVQYREEIMENGVFVSEKLPLEQGSKTSFPLRNRILSGLSLGTVVVEGSLRSGSLVTASLAVQQGKDVFCIPAADIFDSRFSGNSALIRDGAKYVASVSDITDEYCVNYSDRLARLSETERHSPFFDTMNPNADRPVYDAADISEKPAKPKPVDLSELTEEQAAVVKYLSENGETAADDIADALDCDVSQLFSVLTELELMGRISQSAGQHYSIG
ncbi:MAG: DNA-processing protein DprA [Oscillospiraceae bacterium]|nr:DNA-processing protein DprA [Oscillospiraceae bacterium]